MKQEEEERERNSSDVSFLCRAVITLFSVSVSVEPGVLVRSDNDFHSYDIMAVSTVILARSHLWASRGWTQVCLFRTGLCVAERLYV